MHLTLYALQPPSNTFLSAQGQGSREEVNLRHVIIRHDIIIIKNACSLLHILPSHLFISQSLALVVMPSNRFLNSETKGRITNITPLQCSERKTPVLAAQSKQNQTTVTDIYRFYLDADFFVCIVLNQDCIVSYLWGLGLAAFY